MNSEKAIFFKGISVQTVVTILMGLLEIIVFAIMSRLLSKEDFGYFAAITGVMTICTSISEAGMGAAIIQKKEASDNFISTAFTMSWILGLLGSFIVFSLARPISMIIADEHLVIPLRIMSVNIFLACISSVRRCTLIKKLEFKKVGSLNVIAYLVSSSIGVALAFFGYGLYSIVMISVLNLLIFNLLLYTRKNRIPSFGIACSEVKGIVSYGGWLTLSVIANNIAQQMDRLFLSNWISVTALGTYNRPAGFVSSIAQKINGIFDTVLFPMLSEVQNDKEKVKEIFIKSISLLNSFSIVLFAVFFFNAKLIVIVFLGTQWTDLIIIFQIVSIYIIFNIDSRLVDCFFRSLAMVDTGFKLRLISAVVTFVFLFIGSKYNILGVAISLVLANIFTVVMKILVLGAKIKCGLISIVGSWLRAWKTIIPLCFIGIPFLFFDEIELWGMFVFAAIFFFSILIEFVFFPNFVGQEYKNMLYPSVNSAFMKFFNKK